MLTSRALYSRSKRINPFTWDINACCCAFTYLYACSFYATGSVGGSYEYEQNMAATETVGIRHCGIRLFGRKFVRLSRTYGVIEVSGIPVGGWAPPPPPQHPAPVRGGWVGWCER
jgi:hypothetical protein